MKSKEIEKRIEELKKEISKLQEEYIKAVAEEQGADVVVKVPYSFPTSGTGTAVVLAKDGEVESVLEQLEYGNDGVVFDWFDEGCMDSYEKTEYYTDEANIIKVKGEQHEM